MLKVEVRSGKYHRFHQVVSASKIVAGRREGIRIPLRENTLFVAVRGGRRCGGDVSMARRGCPRCRLPVSFWGWPAHRNRPAPRQQRQRVSAPLPKKGKTQKESVQTRCRRCRVLRSRSAVWGRLPRHQPLLPLVPGLASPAAARVPHRLASGVAPNCVLADANEKDRQVRRLPDRPGETFSMLPDTRPFELMPSGTFGQAGVVVMSGTIDITCRPKAQ